MTDDPIMHRPHIAQLSIDDERNISTAENLRHGLHEMAGQVFGCLFDCVLWVALHDVASCEDEDIDEDLENIVLR